MPLGKALFYNEILEFSWEINAPEAKTITPGKDCKNIVRHCATVTRDRRQGLNRHKSVVLWFTGLPASGKSTVAHAVEERLHQMGCRTFVFDGDNVRHGLNRDLGFSRDDRRENIRRIGEMCKLFVEAGVIALAAFISPLRQDREDVKKIIGNDDFIEIFCDCSVEACEARDVKGIYARARRGEIKDFTGISAPYERPLAPDILIETGRLDVEECVGKIVAYIGQAGVLEGQ